MNDNAKQWVAALRSGEYKQGRGVLRTKEDTYCCLGVACELAVKAGIISTPTMHAERWLYDDTERAILPRKVRQWMGLVSNTGYTAAGISLSGQNDKGDSFAKIAGIIESEPKGLFV